MKKVLLVALGVGLVAVSATALAAGPAVRDDEWVESGRRPGGCGDVAAAAC